MAFAFTAFVVLILLGVPVAFVLALIAIPPLIEIGIPLSLIPQRLYSGMESFTLLSIPFFILAGELMDTVGITVRLFNFARTLVGHFRGGLGQVVVVTEYLFSGISGSVVADTAAVGSIVIPALEKNGYTRQKATGIVCGACAMGILVPPSISMIVYGALANVSIGALFAAGFIPAALSAAVIMITLYFEARRTGIPVQKRADFKEIAKAMKEAVWALLMPVIIFGGILGGIFTATEAAVVAVVYALFVDAVVYRKLTWKLMVGVLVRAARTTGVVMLLIAASTIFSWFLTLQQVPQLLTNFVVDNNLSSPVVILLIIVFFLFLGAVMDGLAAMIMAVPILLPVFATVGLDPFHMGIVIVATTGLGIYTPPVGAGLFVACSVGKVTIEETTVAMFPYLVTVTLCVVLIAYVPGIVTFLPRLLGMI